MRSAGDAFGTSIGRETIGVYSQGSVRGFSPVAAGNIRIDGLYFDPVNVPTSRLLRTSTIRVGLSALGSPFAAPTGVVDFGFRRPGDTAAASLLVSFNSWTNATAEIDAVLPASDRLSFGLGASAERDISYNKTQEYRVEGALIARWRPAEGLEFVPFINVIRNIVDDTGPIYQPAADALPPRLPERVFIGPDWAEVKGTDITAGLLADWDLSPDWQLRAGLLRSSVDSELSVANILRDVTPDGTGSHRVVVDPALVSIKTSGEVRLTRNFTDGARRHLVHAIVRARANDRRFGGTDVVELGRVRLGERNRTPRPDFDFSAQQDDRVRQLTLGLGYEGRWDDVGELSAGLQATDYSKRVGLPDGTLVETDARLLLYNVTLAAQLAPGLVFYAGAVTGLEESGIAPANALNRNEALPAIKTRQFDAGLRYAVTPDITLVAGAFDIAKPYFNLGPGGRFDVLGDVINRGVEASVAGPITDTLSVVAGGVLLWPRVTGLAVDLGTVGPRPVGAISHRIEVSGDWRPTFAPGMSLDMRLSYRSAETATVSNLTAIPARAVFHLVDPYTFRLASKAPLLRLEGASRLAPERLELRGAGAYSQFPRRLIQGYVTVDF
ncbi:TonB-dependent receptor [Polymorphobacter multimanifer]|uniref:TonB-dependent receptor domain-containing protein n=1 Tax=Polymorphobacter multimanifer TaxID=1070431 RepID=UPI0019A3F1CC|nr:TonB-dependent receptor [Polymorphobacter multimanifer]GGI91540.1 TonB-dependent receptor [Polymorphobacter multimanifer]